MIMYSDYVLVRKPFAYCRMQEPSSYPVLCDVSGNRNHLYKGHYDSNLKKNVFTGGMFSSQNSLDFIGEPNIMGMRPTGQRLELAPGYTNYSFLYWPDGVVFHDTKNVPDITLRANKISAEFLFKGLEPDTVNYGFYYTPVDPSLLCGHYSIVAALGPVRIINETINNIRQAAPHQNDPPILNSHTLKIIVFENVYPNNWYTTVYQRNLIGDSLLTGSHRIIVGVKWIDSHNFRATVVIDNTKVVNDVLFTTSGTVDFNNANQLREIYFDDPGTTIANFSIGFDQDFPDNDYISKTWSSLNTMYNPTSNNTGIVKRYSSELTSQVIDDAPGSTIVLLDSLLILGCNHRVISHIVVTSGTHVEAFIGSHPGTIYEIHAFSIGDMIQIQGSSQNSVNGFWTITEITMTSIKFLIYSSASDETGNYMIVKKAAFGGSWLKTYQGSGSKVGYQSLDPDAYANILVIDDAYGDAAHVTIDGLVGGNRAIYWRKDLKTDRTTWIKWAAAGDQRRFYLFIAYRNEPVTHSNVCVFGDIQDFVDNNWRTVLVGQKDNKIGNIGFNFAFLYSDWSILPTGHLLCQSIKQTVSDVEWIRNDDSIRDYITGYTDNGHHIYPIPHPIA